MGTHTLSKNNSINLGKLLLFTLAALGSTMLPAMEEDDNANSEDIDHQLWKAVKENNTNKAKTLLSKGGNPNFVPSANCNPLIGITLEKGNIELAEALLEHGATWDLLPVLLYNKNIISYEQYKSSISWAWLHGWTPTPYVFNPSDTERIDKKHRKEAHLRQTVPTTDTHWCIPPGNRGEPSDRAD
jgi:hypothetical protein